MYQEFPMWVTHESGATKIVDSEEDFAELGDGWEKPQTVERIPREKSAGFAEYPKWVGCVMVGSAEEEAEVKRAEAEAALGETDERAMLIQIAEEKGVKIDKRWSDDKIRAALEAAQ